MSCSRRLILGFFVAFIAIWLRIVFLSAYMFVHGMFEPPDADEQWYLDFVSPIMSVSFFPLSLLSDDFIDTYLYIVPLQAYVAGFLVGYLWPPLPWKRFRSLMWLVVTWALLGELVAMAVLIFAKPRIVTLRSPLWETEFWIADPWPYFGLSTLGIISVTLVAKLRRKAQNRGG